MVLFWKRWNPLNRLESFELQLTYLKYMGMWPPDNVSPGQLMAYRVYGWGFRIVFMYIYTLTQLLYIVTASDFHGTIEVMSLLVTQMMLIFKLEMFHKHFARIRKCVRQIGCPLYNPRCDEENEVVKRSMGLTWLFGVLYLLLSHSYISLNGINALLKGGRELPHLAWFPFDHQSSALVYAIVWFYQVFGIFMSASYNLSTDTLAAGLLAHVNGQIERLGIMLTKVGHVSSKLSGSKNQHQLDLSCQQCDDYKDWLYEINYFTSLHGKSYGDLIELVLFHKKIMRLRQEVTEIFHLQIFAQVMASVSIICTTTLRLVGETNDLFQMAATLFYLIIMVVEILLFCFVGNDIIYSTDKFNENTKFSNYSRFNKPTAQIFIIFLAMTKKPTEVLVGFVFKFILSLSTFLWILRTAYSYYAFLKNA